MDRAAQSIAEANVDTNSDSNRYAFSNTHRQPHAKSDAHADPDG